jgi:hypothetical protein
LFALNTALAIAASGGIGVGVGYAIWHTKPVVNPPIIHTYTLHISHKVMIGNEDTEAVLEMRKDNMKIISDVTYEITGECSNVHIVGDVLKYDTPVSKNTILRIKATYYNHIARSSVTLLPQAENMHILDPSKKD